jgi:glycosyltransferase involved in cell wall biosynthesis
MMPKLKILHTTTRLVRGGGVENNIYHTIEQLKDEYEFVLSSGVDMQENPFKGDPKVKVIVCKDLIHKIHPWYDLKALIFYYRLIKREKIDVIHTHETKASFVTKLSAWIARCPYIIYGLHGVTFNDPMSKMKRHFLIFLEQATIGVSDFIVSVSHDTIRHYHENNIGKEIPYTVVRSGIDLKEFFAVSHVKEAEQQKLRDRLGVGPGTRVICNVGRFSFSKAQRYTIQCFALLKKEFPDSKLIFIGEGELLEECKHLSRELRIEDDILFEGYQKNVPLYLSISHLFLFTSLREGLPRVVVEAALMKVPVAAFEVEGIREVIEHDVSGIIVPQYQVDALYEGARRILADETLANRFREKAFRHVEHEWDATKMGEDLRKVYQQAEKSMRS